MRRKQTSQVSVYPEKSARIRRALAPAAFIDLHCSEVVATLNGAHIDAQLAVDTLAKALQRRKPGKGLILHSDQGCQFTSEQFTAYCAKHHIQQSMSQAGCPYDNAPMERFYNTFKHEFYYVHRFSRNAELDDGTYRFIAKYNYRRPHSHNGGLPPTVARLKAA